MAQYPSLIPTYSTKTNEVDDVDASHINLLQDEVIALAAEIGTNPSGTRTYLADRLNAMLNPSGYLISSAGVPQPTAPGFFWYDTDADVMKVIKSDNTVKSVGGSVGNIVFYLDAITAESGHAQGGAVFLATLTPTASNKNFLFFECPADNTWRLMRTTQFYKISGINTVKVQVELWGDGTGTVEASVNLGTVSGTASVTNNSSPAFQSLNNLNVSGLGNGTYYTVNIYIRGSTTLAFMGKIIGFGE